MVTRTGAEQMRAISLELKGWNRKLSREFSKAMRKSVEPVKTAMKAHALEILPHRGGLARRTSETAFRISNTARGVRLVGRAKEIRQLVDLDLGKTRHPVFLRDGMDRRRVPWVRQQVRPGWATTPWEANKPAVQSEMIKAADDMAAKIQRMR